MLKFSRLGVYEKHGILACVCEHIVHGKVRHEPPDLRAFLSVHSTEEF